MNDAKRRVYLEVESSEQFYEHLDPVCRQCDVVLVSPQERKIELCVFCIREIGMNAWGLDNQ